MKLITKDMTIGELLSLSESIAPILQRSGMHCIGCPSSQKETLEEAAAVHGLNADILTAQLNDFLKDMM